jgi:transposase
MYLYFGKRDFTAALNIWRSLQHRLPNDDEVWYFSALLERRLGLFDAAVADFERARLLNPNGVQFAMELGLTLFLLNRFQEAIPVLDAGLSWQPNEPSLLMMRLFCAWNLQGIAGGEKMLAAVKSDGPAVIGFRALQALFARDYKTASALFRRAIDSKDDSLLPISLCGYVPANVEWQLLLALSEQRDGSPAAAAEFYRQVQARAQAALSQQQANRNVEAAWHVALSWADAGLGERDESVAEAQRATALIPESTDTLEGPVWQGFLAKTYAMNGDADHALPLIEQGLGRGRNAMAIWQDLVSDHGFPHGYQTVKRFVRKLRGSESPQAVGIILTAVGEEAQVDYGSGPMVRDSQSGKYRRTRLFVLTLGYSRKSVRLLVWRSSARIWAELHEKAFRRLGGCTRVVVLDNLKEGVLLPDIYDPLLNPLFRDVLAHYGVVALPCRIKDPDRKGKVESGVGHTQKTPLKGMRFESLEEAQVYLDRWEERWADTRIHGTTKRQVAVMFAEEKPHLLPLPLEPFRY